MTEEIKNNICEVSSVLYCTKISAFLKYKGKKEIVKIPKNNEIKPVMKYIFSLFITFPLQCLKLINYQLPC